jgi:hypothetical protein
MNADPADIVTEQLDFTGVKPSSDVKPALFDGISDCGGAANGTGGSIERRHQAVARCLDEAAAVVVEDAINE